MLPCEDEFQLVDMFFMCEILRLIKHHGGAPFLSLYQSSDASLGAAHATSLSIQIWIWTLIAMVTVEALKHLGQPYCTWENTSVHVLNHLNNA